MKTPNVNTIALVALVLALGLMVYLFAGSRGDPSLRIATLAGLVSTLAAIASTILTGKDLTKHDPADLPPNTTTTDTQVVKVGPVPPDPTNPK